MSESAIIKAGFGNGGRGRGIRHSSEATAWKVTVKVPGKVTSKFYTLTRHPGPFDEDKTVSIAEYLAQNTGEREGKINMCLAELDEGGSIIDEEASDITAAPGECCALMCDRIYDSWTHCETRVLHCIEPGAHVNMKKKAGTYYFGIRTWGEDEKKPDYPTPETLGMPTETLGMPTVKMPSDALAAPMIPAAGGEKTPEKWCTPKIGPIPEICLEPWQWVAVAAAGVVTGTIAYAGVRAAKGKPVV